jgi:hypothetical protein
MKRLVLAAAAVLAAVAVWIGISLPPRPLVLSIPGNAAAVRGVMHVHTNRSDGRSSPEEIAAVAAREGLTFVVFTDHGDGTTKAQPPVYRDGVLCIDGVEISTTGGHYLALDMRESPYPLGGEARDVVDDVHRLGGFGVAAHPDSPKRELRWFEWAAPFDGVELMNPDSSWRARVIEPGWRPKARLVTALGTYPVRPAATIAALLGESSVTMARWESLTRRRRVVALGGVDAHAKLAWRDVEPGDNRASLPLPGYRASFQTLSVYVNPERPLSGDAAADAMAITSAIRGGHAYTAVDAIGSPAFLEFTATNRRGTAQAGDELVADGPMSLRVRTNAPAAFTTAVWRGDEVLSADRHERDFTLAAAETPAVYRVEVRATDREHAPLWILSNPIYVRAAGPVPAVPSRAPATDSIALFDGGDTSAWNTETDRVSVAALEVARGLTGPELRFRFGLATGPPAHQFAGMAVFPKGGVGSFDRLTFTARAEQPMRVSVQLRAVASAGHDDRWQRSVYVDTADREQTVFFDNLTPVGTTTTYRPVPGQAHSIVFAIDTTNTRPGTSGRLWLKNVRLER